MSTAGSLVETRKTSHIQLFFPIFATSFLCAVVPFITNLILCRYSTMSLEASLSTVYVLQIFHLPSVALALMAQVYVGRCKGAQEWEKIGPGVWQFIWFSLLSSAVVVPVGFLYGKYYFANMEIQAIAWPYYLTLLAGNFLYPLGTSLASFYLGRGTTRFVAGFTIGALALQLAFSALLIGLFGIQGVAYSVILAQGTLCILLLYGFLSPKAAALYQTHAWHFQPKLFWNCTKEGYLRAASRLITLVAWATAAQLVLVRGGEYALLLCLGGTVYYLNASFSDAMGQTQTIIVSQLIGAKEYLFVRKTLLPALVLAGALVTLMSVPALLFPGNTVGWLFPDAHLTDPTAKKMLTGVWLSVSFLLLSAMAQAYLWAYKDALFLLVFGLYNWIAYFVPIYLAVECMHLGADALWFVVAVANLLSLLLPAWRVARLLQKIPITT